MPSNAADVHPRTVAKRKPSSWSQAAAPGSDGVHHVPVASAAAGVVGSGVVGVLGVEGSGVLVGAGEVGDEGVVSVEVGGVVGLVLSGVVPGSRTPGGRTCTVALTRVSSERVTSRSIHQCFGEIVSAEPGRGAGCTAVMPLGSGRSSSDGAPVKATGMNCLVAALRRARRTRGAVGLVASPGNSATASPAGVAARFRAVRGPAG